MTRQIYSKEERELLVKDIQSIAEKGRGMCREDFTLYEELWPGLFKGRTRTAYALYSEVRRLKKEYNLPIQFNSTPHLDRKYIPRPRKSRKNPIQQKIEAILSSQMRICAKKLAALFVDMQRDIEELQAEVKDLRPFKNLVDNRFKHDIKQNA